MNFKEKNFRILRESYNLDIDRIIKDKSLENFKDSSAESSPESSFEITTESSPDITADTNTESSTDITTDTNAESSTDTTVTEYSASFPGKSCIAEETRKGTVTISCGGKYIHSRYDPVSEAEKLIKQVADTSSDCWVFGGFGLGYHIEAFLKYTDSQKALVVEPDPWLFEKACELRDLSGLLLSGRVILIIGGKASSVVSTLNMFQFEKIKYFQIRSEYDLNKEYFESLQDNVASYVSRKEVNNNTLIRFGRLWVKNLIRNLNVFADSPGIDTIKDKFSSLPALILAGGPGLDKSLEQLKSYREKCLIIAVDTSMSACLRYGVEPDFLVVVDPQYWNYRHLDRCGFKKTIVISEPSTYPHTFRDSDKKYIFASSVFPLGKKYEEGSFIRGKIGAGGSVSTTAWDFARIAGCSPIIFAGLDLSYPDKLTHFKGSFFEERSHTLSSRIKSAAWMDYKLLTDANLFPHPDNSGGSVFTDKRLIIYKQWFEEQHVQHKQETLTLSDKGIRIEGITLTDHDYIISLDDKRENIEDIIESLLPEFNKTLDKNVYADVSLKLIESLGNLIKISEEGVSLSRKLLSDDPGDINIILEKLNNIDSKVLSGDAKDTAGFILQEVSRDILNTEKETDFEKSILNTIRIYENISSACEYHIRLLEKAVKKLIES